LRGETWQHHAVDEEKAFPTNLKTPGTNIESSKNTQQTSKNMGTQEKGTKKHVIHHNQV